MAFPSATPLRIYQWGEEATAGTLVAATSQIAAETVEFTPTDMVRRPNIAQGIMLDNPGNEVVTGRGTNWAMKGPVVYDQLQNFLEMLIAGGVSPTGSSPYVWTYTWTPTAYPALKSWTFQRRITDGSTPIDNRWGYGIAQSLKLIGAENEPLRFEAAGFARRIQTGTLTAAQALPTIEEPPIALTKLFIDTTNAGLGGTQVSAQVLSYDITIRNGAGPRMAADGRADMDFSFPFVDGSKAGIDFNAIIAVQTSSGQYATEKTAAEAQSLRAVRIQADGTASRQIQVDALLKHVEGSLFKIDEQNGMDICTLKLVSATDRTNAFKVKVTNLASALA